MNELMLHISQTNLLSPHYNFCVDLYETVWDFLNLMMGIFIGSSYNDCVNAISDWLFSFGWVRGHERKVLPGYARRIVLLVSYRWYRALARGYRWGFGQACVEEDCALDYYLSHEVALSQTQSSTESFSNDQMFNNKVEG